ncbi:hypothetical protein P7C70_g6985, partial [Phenoliferia sp. Uapishka_3]
MAPDRRLDIDLPALIRLADVPGFGVEWEKLPPFASTRLQQRALEADLDLIYAKSRPMVSFMKPIEAEEYHFYAPSAARKYEDGWIASFLQAQMLLTRRVLLDGPKLVKLWRATDQNLREEIFIASRVGHAEHRGDRTYLLFGDELRMKELCGGNGDGFLFLLQDITFSAEELKNGLPTTPKRKKHAQWDCWMGLGDAEVDQFPLPIALRGFQINMVTFRMGLLIGVAERMLNALV